MFQNIIQRERKRKREREGEREREREKCIQLICKLFVSLLCFKCVLFSYKKHSFITKSADVTIIKNDDFEKL